MTAIATVTLNPALDLATTTPQVAPVSKMRCATPSAEPGGGGVNVARAITQLGGQAHAFVALGGATGQAFGALLDQIGLVHTALKAPGDTRHSLAVTDETTGQQYRFVLPGPDWDAAHLDRALDRLVQDLEPEALVVISGSMPPGCNTGFLDRACAALTPRRVIIDTSGPHLAAQAQGGACRPLVLRMDSHESRDLSGLPLDTRADSVGFAQTLRQRGAAAIVIIARGKDGSVMACEQGLFHVNAANETVLSAIGAGDSFVGGFTKALAEGHPTPEALRHGAAAAAAAVLSPGTKLCRPEDFARLLPLTKLKAL